MVCDFKDDGFLKSKNKGMIDSGKWEEIEKEWLDSYKHRKYQWSFCS